MSQSERPKMRVIYSPKRKLVRLECACGMACIVGSFIELSPKDLARKVDEAVDAHAKRCEALGTAKPYEVH